MNAFKQPQVPVGETILDVTGATMKFGGLVAVNDVSLQVRQGQIYGLLGPNGAGKSTLFNVITGVLSPTAGNIRFAHDDVSRLALHRRSSLGMARTFQIVRVFHGMSVLDNVLMGFHHTLIDGLLPSLFLSRRVFRRERRLYEEGMALLEFVGLAGRAHELVEHLPHGQLRLLEIARALASGPKLLLLDEPAAGLNDQETRNLAQLLRKLNDDGLTILLVEHNIEFMMGLCDHLAVLDQGCKISDGTPAHVQADEKVIEAYLGRRASHA